MILALIIAISFSLSRILRRAQFFAHVFQLEGYSTRSFGHWLLTHSRDAVIRNSHVVGLALLAVGFGAQVALESDRDAVTATSRWALIVFVLLWAAAFSSSRRYRRDQTKKPLVFTPRMKRISAVTLLFLVSVACIPPALAWTDPIWIVTFRVFLGLFAADLLAPVAVLAAGFVLEPLEKTIRSGFKNAARAKLATMPDLQIVAITGSYGKTSVKFAVETVLAHRFDVLATPGSYNTPMGICRVINERLRESHQMLILEMGMRHPGDIAELCEIARPDVALITSVGVAHLETMKTIEAIEKEKASLLSFLKDGGSAVLNGDDTRVLRMRDGLPGPVWVVTTDPSIPADIYADQITYGPEGSTFVVTEKSGESVDFSTRLVGRHNISNILMAVAVGRIYGLRLRQIRLAVQRLQPVPHRLEVKRDGPVTVIDDAFNSNPVGARNAVEILGQFRSGRRAIVTPGMIELGEIQFEENRTLGHHIAANADLVVLVGERQTDAIAQGLRDASYPSDQIHVVRSLFEAQDLIRSVLTDGDTVLYENDLPDQFNES